MYKMNDPKEWEKFRWETARTFVFGVLGTLAVAWAIKPWEQSLEYKAELEKKRLAIRAQVVDDFIAAASEYTATAHDACSAYAARRKRPSDAEVPTSIADSQALTIAKFENEAVDKYRTAIRRVGIYFKDAPQDVSDKVNRIKKLQNDLFAKCNDPKIEKDIWEATRTELVDANAEVAIAALQYLRINVVK